MNKKAYFILSIFSLSLLMLSACQKPEAEPANAAEDVTESDQQPDAREQSAQLNVNGHYELNIEQSALSWSAGKIVGDDYTGKVPLSSGYLVAENGNFNEGEFVINVAEMTHDEDKQAVIDHLKGEDFFNVAKYPTSQFKIISVNPAKGGYQITGDLTIMDQTQPIEFVAQLEGVEEGIKATAEFAIDRTRWGIKYGSANFFDNLGDKAIKNEIGYQLELYFNR